MNPYLVFFLYLLAIVGFVVIALSLNAILGPKGRSSPSKLDPFECGAPPVQRENVRRIPIKYYALAIMFILFDLETVFLYLWAIGSQPLTGFMVITFLVFVFIVFWILLYVWKAGIIEDVTK